MYWVICSWLAALQVVIFYPPLGGRGRVYLYFNYGRLKRYKIKFGPAASHKPSRKTHWHGWKFSREETVAYKEWLKRETILKYQQIIDRDHCGLSGTNPDLFFCFWSNLFLYLNRKGKPIFHLRPCRRILRICCNVLRTAHNLEFTGHRKNISTFVSRREY